MTTVGVGAASGVTAEEVLAAIDHVLPADAGDIRLATLDIRAQEAGIRDAAARRGWALTLRPDGTTEARSPDGRRTLRSHAPPSTRAG